ncbi:MAG: hypothetical protein ACRDK7_15125 [Solirubrobacteraceae bacterium]
MNTPRRPVRLIAPGIYTTFDGRYRVENLHVATGDPGQQDIWDIYRQHKPGVSADTLDPHATALSAGHLSLDDARQALLGICGEDYLVSGCVKECAFTTITAADIRTGLLVDLEGDPFADDLHEHTRYEWELMEVWRVKRESPDCIRVDFEEDSVGFPADHRLRVIAGHRA